MKTLSRLLIFTIVLALVAPPVVQGQSITNFPNGVSSFGIPVMGSGAQIPSTTGSYFFVHSGTGASGNSGRDPSQALATIAQAVAKCTANKADVIVVMPGHAETVTTAAGINLSVAGISVIGLGNNENRPVITFGTSTAATLAVNAANVTVRNLVFKNDIDAQAIMIDVNSTGFTLEGCDFNEGSSKQWATAVDINGGGANACDRATIRNNRFKSIAAGADNAIKLAEVADRVLIEWNTIDGDFNDAGIHNPTGKVMTNLVIKDNVIRNRQTGDHAIELVSACTGEATNNRLFGDTLGTIFDPGSLFCAGNLESNAIDTAGVTTPISTEERVATKAAATMTNGQTIFTITGGAIRILSLYSICITGNDATASTLQYSVTPTIGSAQTISGASASLANATAGATITLAGTALATAALYNANGPNLIANPGTILAPAGSITIVMGVGSTTGTWAHFIRYQPLAQNVTVQ